MQLLDPPVDWLVNLPEEARRREVKMMKVEDARKLAECRFIKPIDDKTFKAAVMNSGAEIPAHLGDEELVLVAEPVAWEIEFRFFLLNGKATTGSVYSRNGNLDEQPATGEEFQTAQKLAEKYAANLPPGVVVDVGVIKNRGWAIVEAKEPSAITFQENLR